MIEKKAHARFSASAASRWLACPGSVRLSESVPPLPESSYAAEGTRAHECLEYLVRNRDKRLAAAEFLRKKYGMQMVVHAEMALKYVEGVLAARPGSILLVEQKCELPTFEPGQFGTTDLAVVEPEGRLEIIDYKYGAGIPVFPKENAQLTYYAIGLAHRLGYRFRSVRLTIVQPRRAIADPRDPKASMFIRSWDTTTWYLKAWLDLFESGMAEAKRPDARFQAGEHCRFCAAKHVCTEVGNAKLRAAQNDFDDGYVD